MKFKDFINCILILNVVLFLISISMIYTAKNNFKYFNETREDGLAGIYYQDMYYCVWVKDRTEYQIAKTEAHELCHHFVYEDYEHFCGDDFISLAIRVILGGK